MTATAHTPGPWHVEPEQATHGHGLAVCAPSNGWIVATVTPEDGRELDPIDHANAHLLAAAPELLAALDYLLEQTVDMDLRYGIGLSEGEEDARHAALAAIAKAHGENYAPDLSGAE